MMQIWHLTNSWGCHAVLWGDNLRISDEHVGCWETAMYGAGDMTAEEHVTYKSPWGVLQGIVFIVLFAFGLCMITLIATGRIESEPGGLVFLILWTLMVGLSVFTAVTSVETTGEGLSVHYLARSPRLMRWGDIREVSMGLGSAQQVVYIRYGRGPFKVIGFFVAYFSQGDKKRVNRLLAAIAQGAGLSFAGTTFWGFPTYEKLLDDKLR